MKFKRLGMALVVLLLLIVGVGIDRTFGWPWLSEMGEDEGNQAVNALGAGDASGVVGRDDGPEMERKRSREHPAEMSRGDYLGGSGFESSGGGEALEDRVVLAGGDPWFYTLRSSEILGTEGEPSRRQKALLLEASAEVVTLLAPAGAILFDVDTEESRGVPVLLYAHSGRDLTRQVQIAYDRLSEGLRVVRRD